MNHMTKGQRALNLFLMLAAAGLALVTVFTLAARLWWAFDLFSHFRLQYVLAAVVLGFLALSVRAHGSAAVLAAVAVVHGLAIKDLWLGGTASAALGGVPLRVVSVNVLAQNRTPEKVLEFVRAADADLVLLLDARGRDWQDVRRELRDLYPHHAPRAWRERGPVVLFSRWPILAEQVLQAPRSRRPYLAAELAIEGQVLEFVGVHPSSPSPSEPHASSRRNRELDHIAEVVQGTDAPVIVAGDFNTTPWSVRFSEFLDRSRLSDAPAGRGLAATWLSKNPLLGLPIDHILVGRDIQVLDQEVGADIGAEHYPISAQLAF